MLPKALIYSVFLLATFVSCTTYIDDQDGTPNLFWSGSWGRYSNLGTGYTVLAWQGTLSLGNQSGATVTFTFTGTSVGVFGSLWPGESDAARSTYVIDNGRPTEFVPTELQQPARLQFYASGTLSEGEHTLKVTNLGAFLWLDYFEYDDVVASSAAGGGTTTTSSPKATTVRPSSTTTTPTTRPPPVTVTTTASPSHDGGGSLSTTTSESSAITSSQARASGTSSTASTSSSSSAAAAPPPLYSVPFSPSSPSSVTSGASSNAPPPPQDATTSQGHAHRLSRGALVGLIAATTAGGVALLALVLMYFVRLRQARSRLRNIDAAISTFQKPAPPSSGSSSEGNLLHSPIITSVGVGASLFSTTMPPSITTVARPSSVCQMPEWHAGEVDVNAGHSCHACGHQPQLPGVGPLVHVRATDGGVSVAGGRAGVGAGLSNAANIQVHGPAPSIFEAEEGEKSTLPPPYPY